MPPHSLAILCSHIHGCCHLCGEPLGNATDDIAMVWACQLVCEYCHKDMVHNIPLMRIEVATKNLPLYVGGFYQMPLKRVMTQYKDKESLSALMVLYHTLCHIPKPRVSAHTVLLPVPTTKARLKKRGFNPVLVLAKFLSYWWQIPLWQGLARNDNQRHQRGLDKAERLANVTHDFYITDELNARQVILFDDVVTTGATLSAVAQTLWLRYPTLDILAVGVLHGTPQLHLAVG